MKRNQIDLSKNIDIEEVAETIVFQWASIYANTSLSQQSINVFINSLSYSLFTGGMGMINCKLLSRQVIDHWRNNYKESLWDFTKLEYLESAVTAALSSVKGRTK